MRMAAESKAISSSVSSNLLISTAVSTNVLKKSSQSEINLKSDSWSPTESFLTKYSLGDSQTRLDITFIKLYL